MTISSKSAVRRGRTTPPKRSASARWVYVVAAFGIIAIVAAGVLYLLPSKGVTVNQGDLASYQSKGQSTAPVTVVEYADFQCPGCAAFATTQEAQFTKDYVDTGKVHFIYHEFPLTTIHPNAVAAAEAGRCAADQSQFWPMHDLLFANQVRWAALARPQTEFESYAQALKLDLPTFTQCITSGKYTTTVKAAEADATQANINQTPTFVVNGKAYDASTVRQGVEASARATMTGAVVG